MDIGVFIPINNNGWIISATSPQYMPSFELNKQVVLKAEAYGLDFALSMIKLHGFGGKTEAGASGRPVTAEAHRPHERERVSPNRDLTPERGQMRVHVSDANGHPRRMAIAQLRRRDRHLAVRPVPAPVLRLHQGSRGAGERDAERVEVKREAGEPVRAPWEEQRPPGPVLLPKLRDREREKD